MWLGYISSVTLLERKCWTELLPGNRESWEGRGLLQVAATAGFSAAGFSAETAVVCQELEGKCLPGKGRGGRLLERPRTGLCHTRRPYSWAKKHGLGTLSHRVPSRKDCQLPRQSFLFSSCDANTAVGVQRSLSLVILGTSFSVSTWSRPFYYR